jgi:thiol-disulfide isomerase/thioredoxin
MSRIARRAFTALVALGLMAPAIARAADRPADEIVKEIEAIQPPRTYAEMMERSQKKAELIGELAKAHPDDARLNDLLPQRWMALAQSGKGAEATKEIDAALAKTKDTKLKTDGTYLKAQITLMENRLDPSKAMPAVDAFLAVAPKDPRAQMLLYSVLSTTRDKDKKIALEDRILKDFPTGFAADAVKGTRKQRDGVGKPFELEFTDAIKGETVSIKGLKGKVVVVDFWATWCGPCVAEMPTMKKLYAEYKDKGVEFVGVSLDQPKEAGGLDKLKTFVKDKEIGWPQYYQGNFWNSEFSKGWGVNSIPCVFIIDADGKLYSTEARGEKALRTLIPELLGKRDKTSAGGGQ